MAESWRSTSCEPDSNDTSASEGQSSKQPGMTELREACGSLGMYVGRVPRGIQSARTRRRSEMILVQGLECRSPAGESTAKGVDRDDPSPRVHPEHHFRQMRPAVPSGIFDSDNRSGNENPWREMTLMLAVPNEHAVRIASNYPRKQRLMTSSLRAARTLLGRCEVGSCPHVKN
jgi:hypothetical protein